MRGGCELALRQYSLIRHPCAGLKIREHDLVFLRLLVVGAFHVDFEESVEQNLGRLRVELLRPLVRSNLECCVKYLGISHLRGDGPFPDEVVELLLLGGSLDLRVLYECRADGLVSLLRPLAVGLELACL